MYPQKNTLCILDANVVLAQTDPLMDMDEVEKTTLSLRKA